MASKTNLACDRCGGTQDVQRGVLQLNGLAQAIGANPFGHLEWDLCGACAKIVAMTVLPTPPPSSQPTPASTPTASGA